MQLNMFVPMPVAPLDEGDDAVKRELFVPGS